MKKANTNKPAPLYLVMSRVNASGDISTRIFGLTRAVLKINNWYYPSGSGTKQVPVNSLNKIDASEMKYKNTVKAYCLLSCLSDNIEALESMCGSIAKIPVAKRGKKVLAVVDNKLKDISSPAPAVKSIKQEDVPVKLLVPNKIFSKVDSEDIDAVNAILSGNKNAFSVIYKRYYTMIRNKYSMSLKFNQDLADDLTEDLFIRVYENIGKYKPEFTFNSWISRIAHNFLVDYTRKKKLETVSLSKTVASESNPNGEPMEIQVQDKNALTGEDILVGAEKTNALNKALMQLDKRTRNVVRMYYVLEKSYKEIQEETGLSAGVIKIILFRAKVKLKDIITSSPELKTLVHG